MASQLHRVKIAPKGMGLNDFVAMQEGYFAAEGLDPSDPKDVMTWIDRTFHQPADLGRAGLPDEVASLVVYLASKRNGYVTGACVNADGGSDFA